MSWRDELVRRFPKLTRLGDPDTYVVGGAVRDLLLGREPLDVDIATIDPLAAAKTIRDRVIRLGDDEQLTAYRVVDGDLVYDFAELLEHDLLTDLARRDFTINAMAVDLATGTLHDPHDGRRDLASRVVRMVRASNFDDDPLRMLKGVRMAIRYDFAVDDATLRAIQERAQLITTVAKERVTYELSMIFSANQFRRAVALLRETGLGPHIGFRTPEVFADDVSLDGAYALLSDEGKGDALTLRRLIDAHDRIALYDAGETVARQLPAVLRALGRDDQLDWPDFAIRALLTGDEIAKVTGLAPGKELGAIKRALLEAQIRGEVTTREDAMRFAERRRPAG
jgi:tRNA nucleotidyltransferase/poly(A) polymerase